MTRSVFISSTALDLRDHRAAVDAAIRRLEQRPINMQDFGSQPGGATGVSLREVAKGDVFIGVLARRYGYVPEGMATSVTEQEYDEAVRLKKPRLMYLVDPAHEWDWPGKADPANQEDADKQAKLAAFIARVEATEVRSHFTTPDNLAQQVTADLTKLLDQQRRLQLWTRALMAAVIMVALVAAVLIADPGIRSDVIEIAGLASATPTATNTPTATHTPTATLTPTSTATPTATPTITPTALEGTPFAENMVGVVLADFTNLDDSNRAIEASIERAFEDAGVPFVRVRHSLHDQADAEAAADLYNATVTIYGESQAEGVEVRYAITPRRSRVFTNVERVTATADLLNFNTYIFEGVDALYVVDFVRGQLAYFDDDFEQALTFFENALERLPEDRQEELGAASLYFYSASSLQDDTTEPNPRPRLETVIDLYVRSLPLVDLEQLDGQNLYAITQNNLGAAYRTLAGLTELEANLERAIAAFAEALRFHTPEASPLGYAAVQNNLGTAYWQLAGLTDPEANLERAIAAYEEALRFRTPEASPLDYAATQHNLGTAYGALARLTEPEANLERAIAAFEEALRFHTPEASPLDYANTQINLGAAYNALAGLTEPEANLERAIAAFEEALRFHTPEASPLDYAAAQNNLGNSYRALAGLTEPEANLERAIAAFEEALRFRTLEVSPLDYAQTITNLGLVFHQRGDQEEACTRWREAVTVYAAAGITARVEAIQSVIDQACPDPNSTPTATP
jgi:tetratricopeptide (TPR) repeat protein